jgi:WD40 repeat protein
VVPHHGAAGDEVHLWQPGAAEVDQILSLPGRAEALFAAAAPGGVHIAVARVPVENPLEGEIQLWNVAGRALVGTVAAPGAVEQGTWTFTAGGERLLISAGAGEVTVWDSATMAQMGAVSLSSPYPLRALFGEVDGFLAVHANGVVQRFDGAGEAVSRTDPLDGTIIAADRSAGGSTLSLVDFDGAVHLLRAADLSAVRKYDAHASGEINALSFAPDGARLALATSTGEVRLRPVDGSGVPVAFDRPGLNVDSVAVSPDGSGLALGVGERLGATAFDDTVQVWGLADGQLRLDLGGDGEEVLGCSFFRNRVRFAPAGDLLALNSHDFTVSLWEVAGGQLLHTFPPHASSVLDLAFSPDGSLLATSSDDSTLRLWRTGDFQLLYEQVARPGGYWSLTFSPDGRWLAASTLAGEILLLDPASGAVQRTLSGEKSRYSDLAFSPDGRLLAAGDDENHVVLWSVSSGAVQQRLAGHSGPVVAIAFSPDGRLLASGSRDYTVRLWSVGE